MIVLCVCLFCQNIASNDCFAVAVLVGALQQELNVRIQRALQNVPGSRQVLHLDGWSDPWKRVWVGACVRFLTDDWELREICVGFEHAATWASEDAGSQHAAAPAATAIRRPNL